MAILKRFCIYLWFVIVMVCTMVLLMWAVYSIPVQNIRKNVKESATILTQTPHFLWYKHRVPGGNIDKITDARMLTMTSFLGRSDTFRDSMLNPEIFHELWAHRNLAISLEKNTLDGINVSDYPRFWHGYLVFLKPLSLLFNLWHIRIINLILQLALLISILVQMYKRLGIKHCVAFITAMCFLNPYTSWMCLEYATDINIMLLAVLWVLLNKNPKDNYMFFIIGAVTILFDFLTFPLITLGIPLIVYVCLYQRSFKENIFCVLRNSFLWGVGYLCMISSKWGIATLLTGQNVWKEGWDNVAHRTYGYVPADSILESNLNFQKAVQLNFDEIYGTYAGFYFLFFFVSVLAGCLFFHYRLRKEAKAVILLGISLMPFVWYAVFINHSVVHPYMTYKILIITIYAILAAIVCCLTPKVKR